MPFRPSVVQMAHLMTPFLDDKATVGDALPLPKGIQLIKCKANDQLQVMVSEVFSRRMRRVFGWIAELKLDRTC